MCDLEGSCPGDTAHLVEYEWLAKKPLTTFPETIIQFVDKTRGESHLRQNVLFVSLVVL